MPVSSSRHVHHRLMAPKWCAPYCTIGCVHRVSFMDFWRKPQKDAAPAVERPAEAATDVRRS